MDCKYGTMISERYLLGELTEADREGFEAHIFDCKECADDMNAGLIIIEVIKQDGQERQGNHG